ncbi:hypothetical protein NARC_70005 [Candidatus Nitrosocosmicus arcticus]|uniref:Uncharacterized protein n=1 Tax=Candidatus Nitrosocosmicus arcticus TaxID=2035267 RepID=A0A557SUZ8_9ARCH|nr:hypothetical protein NARC_70005 [Candidatus Nitrosocosmicus arcticus]
MLCILLVDRHKKNSQIKICTRHETEILKWKKTSVLSGINRSTLYPFLDPSANQGQIISIIELKNKIRAFKIKTSILN